MFSKGAKIGTAHDTNVPTESAPSTAFRAGSEQSRTGSTLQSLHAEKQPDVAAHRFLMTVEVTDEKVELAVLVPVRDVDPTSIAFIEVAACQIEQFALLEFGFFICACVSKEVNLRAFGAEQQIRLAVPVPVDNVG